MIPRSAQWIGSRPCADGRWSRELISRSQLRRNLPDAVPSVAVVSKRAKRALWSAVAILVLVGPPAVFLGRQGVEAGELLELAIVLSGIVASVAMVLATVGASRLRALTTALGIDRIISGHKWLGVAALVLVLGHMVAAIIESRSC